MFPMIRREPALTPRLAAAGGTMDQGWTWVLMVACHPEAGIWGLLSITEAVATVRAPTTLELPTVKPRTPTTREQGNPKPLISRGAGVGLGALMTMEWLKEGSAGIHEVHRRKTATLRRMWMAQQCRHTPAAKTGQERKATHRADPQTTTVGLGVRVRLEKATAEVLVGGVCSGADGAASAGGEAERVRRARTPAAT